MSGDRSQESEGGQPWTQRLQDTVDRFNAAYPVGTPVRAWPGVKGDHTGTDTKTRSEAYVLSGHTPVVFVEGHSGCIALTHIQPLESAS